MNLDVAIRLFYKDGGVSLGAIPEEELMVLKSNLQARYVVSFQDSKGPQAGGILDTIVNIFTNIQLEDVIELTRDGLIFDLITRRKDSIILKPLIKAFQDVESSFPNFDYARIVFHFDDTIVKIFGANNLFTSIIGSVFPIIIQHYYQLILDGEKPYSINIPVLLSDNSDNSFWTPEGSGDTPSLEEYLTFWGIEYKIGEEKKIYQLKNKEFIEGIWR